VVFGLLIGSIGKGAFAQANFTNVSGSLGIDHTYGVGFPAGGISAVDFDGDGLDDITLTTGSGSELMFYRNEGNQFSRMNFTLPNTTGEAKQILWVDFDNDGDKDLYVTFRDDVNRLFQNDGNFNFTDITNDSGLYLDIAPTFGAAWADYDRDGWLDLYITNKESVSANNTNPNLLHRMSNHLFRNKGDATFEETTTFAHVADSAKQPFVAYFFDYDNDGWEDIYIAQDRWAINTFFRNNGDGTFQDLSKETYSDLAMGAMCVTIGDYDTNGFMDIYVTNIPEGNKLLRNDGLGYFTEVANNTGTGFFYVGWGSQFVDVDNDTDLDLYVNGSRTEFTKPSSTLYVNTNNGLFEKTAIPGDTASSFSNAMGDFNNDGYPDLVVNNPTPYKTFVWSNQNSGNNWIKIDLEGVLSNRDGIGTQLEVYLDGKKYIRHNQCGTGFLGQNSTSTHFGLGSKSKVDSLILRWPSNHIDKFFNLQANKKYHFIEGESGTFTPKLNRTGEVILCDGDSLVLNAGLYGKELNYLWSDGSVGSRLEVRNSGKYAVSVTDPTLGIQYQSDTVTVTVKAEPAPLVSYTKSNVSCYGMHDGTIQLNITGGSNNTVDWAVGATGQNLDSLGRGAYTYTISNAAGCSTSGVVVISEPDSIGGILVETTKEGGRLISVMASGGTPPYVYDWSHSNETSPEVLIAENGEYDVRISDSNGCSMTKPFTIDNLLVTAIDNRSSNNQIYVYPNPTNGDVRIDWGPTTDIVKLVVLRNLSGNEITRAVLPDNTRNMTFTMKDVPSGLYLLTIMMKSGKTEVRKLLIN